MRWEDERYVRIYTRDTADWLALSFEAQSLLPLILRKLDRAGRMKLGKHGKRAVAICLGHPGKWDAIAPALEELLSDGCLAIDGDSLFAPNFVAAQESVASNAKRCRDYRERVSEASSDTKDVGVDTKRVAIDTQRHDATRCDTPSRAVPSVPSIPTTTATTSAEASSAPEVAASEPPQHPPQQTTANGAAQVPGHAGSGRAAPKPDADPRHAAFIAAAHRLFAAKVPGGNLTVNGKDGTHLRDFLACQPKVTVEQFERVYLTAVGLGGKWPGCTRVADVVDRWTDLLALSTGSPVKANGGIRGHGRRWWQDLGDEQRQEFMRERHELAPELDDAPLDVAGEVGRERKDVLALIARWRALAERRAMA